MESIMKSDGSKVQNFIVNQSGAIERPQHNVNGILVSYILMADDNGAYLKPCVSTLIIDERLSDKMSEIARELLRCIPTIPQPPTNDERA